MSAHAAAKFPWPPTKNTYVTAKVSALRQLVGEATGGYFAIVINDKSITEATHYTLLSSCDYVMFFYFVLIINNYFKDYFISPGLRQCQTHATTEIFILSAQRFCLATDSATVCKCILYLEVSKAVATVL